MGWYIHVPYSKWVLTLCRLTRPRLLTKLRMTSLSLLASQWMIFLSPKSDRHRLISVVDLRWVEPNPLTHLPIQDLLVLWILYLHEYFSVVGLDCLFFATYSLYLYAQTPLSLSTSAYDHSHIMTLHDFDDSSWLIMFRICFHITYIPLSLYLLQSTKAYSALLLIVCVKNCQWNTVAMSSLHFGSSTSQWNSVSESQS